jgi:hypothetical protein
VVRRTWEGEPRTDRWTARRATGRGTARTAGQRVAWGNSKVFRGAGRPGDGARPWVARDLGRRGGADAEHALARQRFTVPLFEHENLQNFE